MVEQRQIASVQKPAGFGPHPGAPTQTMTPKEIFGILRRHIWLIVSMTILGFIFGGAAWFLLMRYAPKYTAKTFIRVLPPAEKDPMTIGGGTVNKDVQYGFRLSMAELLKQQSSLQKLIERDKVKETKWFKRFGEIEEKRIKKSIRDLEKHLGALPQRDADTIIVSMTCGDSKEASLIVNEMVELFLASQGSSKRRDVSEKLARLEDQRNRVQRDLNQAEQALEQVRRQYGFIDLETKSFLPVIELKLSDLETAQDELAVSIAQIQGQIERLVIQATGPINVQVENQIEYDPIIAGLANQIAIFEATLAGMLTRLGENHRSVRQFQEQINETRIRRQIRKAEIADQTRRSNVMNAQDGLIILQTSFEELEKRRVETEARKNELDLARVQYKKREVRRDERQEMLDSVIQQIEKLKILHDDPETPKVRFVGYAPEPLRVSSPKWEVYFPGGTMLGLMAGVGLAFLIELLNDLVRTPRDISRHLHIPLLGVIPDVDEDDHIHELDPCHVVRQAPYSIISEAYRRFRTNLKLSNSSQSSKVLLVSSGKAQDGKTSVAVNLASTFVAENKKVLLIDTNFWRPSLHKLFPVNGSPDRDDANDHADIGLSNLFNGRSTYQEVIRPSDIDGLDIIDSGPLPFNPAELISGPQIKELIEAQRNKYDYIIVDGPPVLLVSDVKMLARIVDGTILVFNAGATRRGAAQRTIRELNQVNANIVGCVLLAVKAMKGGYFTEQFKSHMEYQKLQLARST